MPVIYQRLTDRTLATGATKDDLIHIVIPSDISQDPDGSSYKITLEQLQPIFSGNTFTGGSSNCITDFYVSNIHSCSPLNVNPLDEGNVYFGSTSGVTVDVINSRIGVNTDSPQYTLEFIGTQSKLYYDPESVGGMLSLSGNTNIPRYGFGVSPYLTKPAAGGSLGMRSWSDSSYPYYGDNGDIFLYAGNEANALNIINGPGTLTEDSIKFYAGIYPNAADAQMTIIGTGTTKGYVGIGTENPSQMLHVNGNTIINGGLTANTISATTYYNLPTNGNNYLPLSGGTVTGGTKFLSGLTANTLNVTGLTQTKGVTSTGGITFKQVTVNSTYSATTEDYMIDITGGTFSVYIPSAVGIQGRILCVKNNGGGAVTVQPTLSQTIDDKPYLILSETNAVQLVSNGSQWVILGQDRSTVNNSTGVFVFSGLSKVSSTQFSVAPIRGWIVDDTTNPLSPQILYVDYSGGTHTDSYVTTAFETFVYLTSGGTISQQPTPLTEQQRRQNIFLGKIGHPEKTSINLVFSQPDFVLSPLAQLRDMFSPINLINGGVYPSANGANLKFNTSAGNIYGLGINFTSSSLSPNSLSISGTSPCTFQYRTQTGGTVTNVTDIDPLNYDVGGVKTTVTGTKATNQRIYLLQNGTFRVQYGQTTYNTMALAIEALQTETFTPFPNFVNNAVLIGILTVLSTATDLTDTTKARFFFSSKFGETVGAAGGVSTTNLQQAYNNSSDPEITINSTLDGLSIKNGTGNADNVTSLIQGLNTAGNVTSFIRADGAISATTLSATTIGATGNCVTDLYVTNIHSCSPLNIQPNNEGSVNFGSTSGVTIDVSNKRLGVGITPTVPLHVKSTAIPSTNENIIRLEVSDAANSYLAFNNASTTDGVFVPEILGRQSSSNNQSAIYQGGYIDSTQDSGSNPVTVFRSALASLTQVVTRPLFSFRNWSTTVMTILANGNVGIGTLSPTEKLEVSGNTLINGDLTVTGTTKSNAISATTLNIGGSQIESAWTTYVPTWTASVNPAINNGTIEGYYKVIGKTCFVRGNVAMGSTTTYGTGEWLIGLPFPAKNADGIQMTVSILHASVAWYNGILNGARAGYTDKSAIQYQNTGGTTDSLSSSTPFVWGAGSRFTWNGSYEIA